MNSSEHSTAKNQFPTGVFSAGDGKYILEFGEDHRFKFIEYGNLTAVGTFSINGNEITWETDSFCDQENLGKATYIWQYDKEMLSFQLIGKDKCSPREGVINGVAFQKEGT